MYAILRIFALTSNARGIVVTLATKGLRDNRRYGKTATVPKANEAAGVRVYTPSRRREFTNREDVVEEEEEEQEEEKTEEKRRRRRRREQKRETGATLRNGVPSGSSWCAGSRANSRG